jgi:hypothetical protein
MDTYKILRCYAEGHPKEIIATGLTLEEAQEHCNNPETSSRTCKSSEGKRRTRQKGEWFDAFYAE